MTRHRTDDDPRWDRLFHLVAGELSSDEAADVRAWAAAAPDRRQALAELETVWHVTIPSGDMRSDAWDAEAELRRIRDVVGETGRVIARVGPDVRPEKIHGRRTGLGAALRVAAAVTLVAGGGLLWRFRTPASVSAPTQSGPAMAEYRTALGERLSLGLPDGTRVMLAPGSVLRRPLSYGDRERTVYLEGEAYFYVVHNAARPFAVRTARAVVRDLGTRFIVRSYPDEPTAEVVVSDGLVAVARATSRSADNRQASDSLLLRSGQRASITGNGSVVFTDGVSLDAYFGWTSGQLVFQRTPLNEVVRRLRRWYGIDIRIADGALAHYRVTATLREEGAAAAVDLIATSLELTVSRSGSAYILGRAAR